MIYISKTLAFFCAMGIFFYANKIAEAGPVHFEKDLNRKEILKRRYESSPNFREFDLRVVRAFDWRYRKMQGTIVLAQARGPAPDMACLVYSATRGRFRYVATSQWRTTCHWGVETAASQFNRDRLSIKIKHEINYGVEPDGYFEQILEIFYDARRRDFCSISDDVRIACLI